MELQRMETNERTSEEGSSIFGLSTSVSMEEDVASSLMNPGGPMMTFRGRSKVWSEFFVTQDGKKVTCRRCGDSLAYSNSHSTSSMLKHLKRKHHMDLYPSAEEETLVPKLPRAPEKSKKGNKATKRAPSPQPTEEQCIQHDPLEFNEACIRMRWTDHSDTFLRNFACMYDDEVYTDVTIVAEKQFFKAHRIILSSASEFFDETFKLTASGQHPVIFLKDTKALELRMLLDFIYRGEVSIPPNLIPDLVKIGSDMRVRGLCDFVWNESMVSTAFQGYANESRASVPRSNEMPSNSAHMTSQSSSFGGNGNSTISSRSLENLLRQQSDQLSPCYSQVNNPGAEGRTVSSGETQNSSSSTSVQPRRFPGSAVKRIRVLPTGATINESATTETVQNRLDVTSNSEQDMENSNLLIMTNDGQPVMSTPHGSLSVNSSRCPQFTNPNVRIPVNEGLHEHHDLEHVVKSQSQSGPMHIPEVVYSIRNVEVSGGQSEDEILLSDTGDGEHTIVVYGDSEDHTATCGSDRKPF